MEIKRKTKQQREIELMKQIMGKVRLVSELYRPLGMDRRNCYRMVNDLSERGFIEVKEVAGKKVVGLKKKGWRKLGGKKKALQVRDITPKVNDEVYETEDMDYYDLERQELERYGGGKW
jgi:hypothetical protein